MFAGYRGVGNKKTRVDEARPIDILDLQRKGVFVNGPTWNWTVSWSRNDQVVASISYRVESGDNGQISLRFMYTITDGKTGNKKDFNYSIPVVSTSCNYGGVRWWFVCPLVVNGQACTRRCRIVYMPQGAEYFGCRECHQLTYESRQLHRDKFYEGFQKPYVAAEAAREKLAKSRSWKKKETLWRKLSRAHSAIMSFENILTSRKPTII